MEFSEVIERRRSIRKYKKIPISREKIEKILEAGRKAPSAFNTQPWHFIVVKDEELKRQLADPQSWAADAPVMIVVLGLEFPNISDVYYPQYLDSINEYHENKEYLLDVGIAFEHVILAATDQGLATCWMRFSWDRNSELKKLLGFPDKYRVIARTPLGYADEGPNTRSRKAIEEIVSLERFEKKS
jgi:nitroreductase